MIIDAHAHFVPQALIDDLVGQKHPAKSVKVTVENGVRSPAFGSNDAKRTDPRGMETADARQKWLRRTAMTSRWSAAGSTCSATTAGRRGGRLSRFLNAHMLAAKQKSCRSSFRSPLCRCSPARSRRHDPRGGARCGFHGAMIGTQPKGAAGVLDDPDLTPFWEAASARKATLFVHPTFGARDDRLRAYGLVSAVGRVTDTSIAIARLLYSGHLTRFSGVNLVISHGGAALPIMLGRLRQSFATAPAENSDPVGGFRRLYVDSIVYDARTVRFIADILGPDRVLMGTDLPFAIAEGEPIRLIDAAASPGERAAILGGTAASLFRVPVAAAA
jgi:aminocarboxymuconate-semialdehyde decarboxylase